MKRCRACNKMTPATGFYSDPRATDGLTSQCRGCEAERRERRRGQPCSVRGCEGGRFGRGLCGTHYKRLRKGEDLDAPVRRASAWKRRPDGRVGYRGAHSRVQLKRGRAALHRCSSCGVQAEQWAYNWLDPDELVGDNGQGSNCAYSDNPDYYVPLCRACHIRLDARAGR